MTPFQYFWRWIVVLILRSGWGGMVIKWAVLSALRSYYGGR